MAKLSEEQVKSIINLYNNGMSPKNIGEKFGILNNSVTRLLRRNGVARNQSKSVKLSEEKVQYIIEQYNKGSSTTVIAEELGIYDATVGKILKRNNIIMRENIRNKRVEKDQK